ncbi:hypothetical protein AMECASPLE_039267 [Ameca splendens]|uniref:Uncharacterized protein n=1 Tax=Ameca splendens TaxID=208324 RepID=A0ABV0XLF4_9TELE
MRKKKKKTLRLRFQYGNQYVHLGNNKIMYSSSSASSGSRGQQTQQRRPDVPLPRHLLQLLRVEPKAFPGQPRHSPFSVSWAVPWASSQWDVPGTPPEEGVQEASGIQVLLKILAYCDKVHYFP